MGAVGKHQRRQLTKIQPHHRFPHRKRRNLGGHFGHHRRLAVDFVLGRSLLGIAGQDVLLRRQRFGRRSGVLAMVAQPVLVAP